MTGGGARRWAIRRGMRRSYIDPLIRVKNTAVGNPLRPHCARAWIFFRKNPMARALMMGAAKNRRVHWEMPLSTELPRRMSQFVGKDEDGNARPGLATSADARVLCLMRAPELEMPKWAGVGFSQGEQGKIETICIRQSKTDQSGRCIYRDIRTRGSDVFPFLSAWGMGRFTWRCRRFG